MPEPFTITPDHLQYVRNVAHNGVAEARRQGINRLSVVAANRWIPFRLVPDASGEIVLGGNGNEVDAVVDWLIRREVVVVR